MTDMQLELRSAIKEIVEIESGAAPNGLAFSCRERAGKGLKKINDLAREAVS